MEHNPSILRKDEKGKKRARFIDLGVTVNKLARLPKYYQDVELFDIRYEIEREFKKADRIVPPTYDDCNYLKYGDAPGDRELVPLRNILPHFHNGQPIAIKQK
jgi:hypothetical protein